MKQIFTLLIASITSVSLYAYPDYSSKMTINSATSSNVRVMVDGNRYKLNDNSITINNLRQGYHSVKVYRQVRGIRPGYGNNSNYQLLYSANVYVKPQYHVDITINRFGKAFIDEQPVSLGYNVDGDDWGDNNWNDNNWNDNNCNNNTGMAMNSQSFSSFRQSLQNERFDNTRMNMAKTVINANYFTTAQIKELMPLFSFEGNKLEIAKYAYKNTLDKNNYFSIADSFTFSSNKEELMQYIQNYR